MTAGGGVEGADGTGVVVIVPLVIDIGPIVRGHFQKGIYLRISSYYD